MKRPLTEEEKTQSLKGVDRLEEDLKRVSYANKRIRLQLDEGLEITRLDLEKEFKKNSKDVDYLTEQINILKDQILNGVEVKNMEEVKNE